MAATDHATIKTIDTRTGGCYVVPADLSMQGRLEPNLIQATCGEVMGNQSDIKTIATNRKASHDYILEERFEAGIVLTGSEIKSIRARQVSLKEAHIQVDPGGAWLVNAHIAPYNPANQFNHDPRRRRKLLLHKREISTLQDKVRQRGFTIIPLRLYLKAGLAKVEIALARGKRQYDKRRELAKKAADRDVERALAQGRRGE